MKMRQWLQGMQSK